MIDVMVEQLNDVQEKFNSISSNLGLSKLNQELLSINNQLMDSAIYSDLETSKKLFKQKSKLENSIEKITRVEEAIDDFKVAIEFLKSGEESILAELEVLAKKAKEMVNLLYLETLYSGKYDDEDVLLEIHAGAGGE